MKIVARGDIIGRDASSELPVAGSISTSAANGEAGEPGGREGRNLRKPFLNLWPWPWRGLRVAIARCKEGKR